MANERGCQGTREYRGRLSCDRLVASVVRVASVCSIIMHGTGIIFRYSRECSCCILSVGKNCYCFSPHIQLSLQLHMKICNCYYSTKLNCYTGVSLRKVYLEF